MATPFRAPLKRSPAIKVEMICSSNTSSAQCPGHGGTSCPLTACLFATELPCWVVGGVRDAPHLLEVPPVLACSFQPLAGPPCNDTTHARDRVTHHNSSPTRNIIPDLHPESNQRHGGRPTLCSENPKTQRAVEHEKASTIEGWSEHSNTRWPDGELIWNPKLQPPRYQGGNMGQQRPLAHTMFMPLTKMLSGATPTDDTVESASQTRPRCSSTQ